LKSSGVQEPQDIYVRAHAPLPSKPPWQRKVRKWPQFALIFDTETTLDPAQKLTFGCYRLCELIEGQYRCVEEGLFHADALKPTDLRTLKKYVDDIRNVPHARRLPPQVKLKLMSRTAFVNRVFFRAVRNGDLVVGFNLPFDISRLAIKHGAAKRGGWSLVLSAQTGRRTGKLEANPQKPRIVLTSLNSKTAFIRLSSKLNREEWPNEPRFLDLRTLTWALRNESYSLDRACQAFGLPGKMKHKPTGRVVPDEIKYCRKDVAASNRLLDAAKAEFDQHPIRLYPDQAYSPASIAKAYLTAMTIARPKAHFKVPGKAHGIAMQSYYGGRAECRIRKTPVPVIHTDFTSQYPTVNALLGNWDVLKSKRVRFESCTSVVRRLLSTLFLAATFRPDFWKGLSFFALVKPENDVLPVRTVYNGRTQNIGINYLRSPKPIWYAGPDLIASTLLTGKTPKVLKALRMVPVSEQDVLRNTSLGGKVPIDPRADDFFVRVIEQRSIHKRSNKAIADFLKVVANAGSYGLFVQVDAEIRKKPTAIKVFSGEKRYSMMSEYVEKAGAWYFPPLASLITSGGRLLLAMLEKCVKDAGGEYLFCDTDSMCIVATKHGGLVPCIGGSQYERGKPAIKALSLREIKSIVDRFNRLSPYDRALVPSLLKIEDVNFVGSDPSKPYRQLFGYAIAAKRYALYTKKPSGISIVKASGHGLGYLHAPKETRFDDEEEQAANKDDAPEWIKEAWEWLLRRELGVESKPPDWLDLPAMMRMAMTSPNVMRTTRPDWLAPFNFFLIPLLSDMGGYPAGFDRSNFKFITPTESDRAKWMSLKGVNLLDTVEGRTYQISMTPDPSHRKVVPESMRIILRQYLGHPEAKSLGPDGNVCGGTTAGLLQRTSILAGETIPIGKETDRHWEQGEDSSLLDFKLHELRKRRKLLAADPSDIRIWKEIGVRTLMRKSGLSQKAVYAILAKEPVRRQTLAAFREATRDVPQSEKEREQPKWHIAVKSNARSPR
jgi:hypothetical protein